MRSQAHGYPLDCDGAREPFTPSGTRWPGDERKGPNDVLEVARPVSVLGPAFAALLDRASREDLEVAFRLIVVHMHGRGVKPEEPEMRLLAMIK